MMDRATFLKRSSWVAVGGLFLPNLGLVFGQEAVEAFAALTPQPARVFTGLATIATNGWYRTEFVDRGVLMQFVVGTDVARPFGHGWQRVLSQGVGPSGTFTYDAPHVSAPHAYRVPKRLYS